jgi:hypothetical protein
VVTRPILVAVPQVPVRRLDPASVRPGRARHPADLVVLVVLAVRSGLVALVALAVRSGPVEPVVCRLGPAGLVGDPELERVGLLLDRVGLLVGRVGDRSVVLVVGLAGDRSVVLLLHPAGDRSDPAVRRVAPVVCPVVRVGGRSDLAAGHLDRLGQVRRLDLVDLVWRLDLVACPADRAEPVPPAIGWSGRVACRAVPAVWAARVRGSSTARAGFHAGRATVV